MLLLNELANVTGIFFAIAAPFTEIVDNNLKPFPTEGWGFLAVSICHMARQNVSEWGVAPAMSRK